MRVSRIFAVTTLFDKYPKWPSTSVLCRVRKLATTMPEDKKNCCKIYSTACPLPIHVFPLHFKSPKETPSLPKHFKATAIIRHINLNQMTHSLFALDMPGCSCVIHSLGKFTWKQRCYVGNRTESMREISKWSYANDFINNEYRSDRVAAHQLGPATKSMSSAQFSN